MNLNHEWGRAIEKKAEEYLVQKGLVLLHRNYRVRMGEIDLIFEEMRGGSDGVPCLRELVFVEVRARHKGTAWVDAVESVDWKKQRRLKRTISFFLSRYHGKAKSLRFDIMAWDGEAWTHLENVWMS